MKNKLIIIAGPTAVGKTDISIELCKRINGSVISADSMQVYKYMDIGSAKITKDEMQDIKHYCIDILEPEEEYNVNIFQNMAKNSINDCYANGKIPVLVGGTGFYIQSVLYDIDFENTNKDNSYRQELEQLALQNGNEYVHNMLKEIDIDSYNTIHSNNLKRVIRALEYYKETGMPISKHNEEQKAKESPYDFHFFVLTDERDLLYSRINKRVDIMLENGLIEEVKFLKDKGISRNAVSMQGIGYKEIYDYLDGKYDLETAIETLKQETRRFAKRQITWFKREKDAIWINRSQYPTKEQVVELMLQHINNAP